MELPVHTRNKTLQSKPFLPTNDPFSSPLKAVISQTNKSVRKYKFGMVALKSSQLSPEPSPLINLGSHRSSYTSEGGTSLNSKEQLMRLKGIINLPKLRDRFSLQN